MALGFSVGGNYKFIPRYRYNFNNKAGNYNLKKADVTMVNFF
jgi:hypothetical protein